VALVDTGADFSVLPKGTSSRLGLALARKTFAAGVDGVPRLVSLWHVTFDTPVGGFQVKAAEWGDVAVIGRDVLNQIVLSLDGPNLQLSV
jgi:predicted aspartyl protease